METAQETKSDFSERNKAGRLELLQPANGLRTRRRGERIMNPLRLLQNEITKEGERAHQKGQGKLLKEGQRTRLALLRVRISRAAPSPNKCQCRMKQGNKGEEKSEIKKKEVER